MIVTAALIWWNELPDDLERCIRGLGTIADRVVAVDGAYARYPGATVRSPKAQENAIRRAAKTVGIEADVVIPTDIWAGGVAKRAFTLSRAAEGSDWVVALDADWVISGDREAVRAELAATDADVLSAHIYTPPSDREPATGWHRSMAGHSEWISHVYRALPELTCEKFHWWFSARKGRHKVWLWGPPNADGRALLPSKRLEAEYGIQHMTLHRTRKQVLASRAFLNDRTMVVQMTGQEDDRDDLPRPVFDFDTILEVRAQRLARHRMSPRQKYLLRKQGMF